MNAGDTFLFPPRRSRHVARVLVLLRRWRGISPDRAEGCAEYGARKIIYRYTGELRRTPLETGNRQVVD